MSKEFKQLVDQHIINEQQEELVEHYSHARETDLSREENIKQKLNARFFNVPKPKKRKISPKMPAPEPHLQLRQRMSQEMKDSLTLSRSRPPPSSRYARKSSSPRPPNSPRSPLPSSPHSATLDASSLFTLQLNDLIASSQRRPAVSSSLKRNIVTATDRKKRHEREFHSQREEIIDKIIENDVEELMRCQARGGSVGDARGLIEAIRREELSNLDKYSMSFTNYMRQKTYKNIEKAIYNDRIRQKQTYVEKFQDFILTEFKFSQ